MKKVILLLFFILSIGTYSCDKGEFQRKKSLHSESDSLSYSLGLKYGQNLKKEGIDIDWPAFVSGMQDRYGDQGILLSNTEIVDLNRRINLKKIEKRKQYIADEKEKNQKFLEENKTKPGVITTESGLQYKVIKEGDGPKPGPEDEVSAHYIGHLIDGSEFDNSYTRGTPLKFPLSRVIKGWQEGLQLMSVGSRYKLYIPSEIGYGQRHQAKIPANSTLIFEVELLEIIDVEKVK